MSNRNRGNSLSDAEYRYFGSGIEVSSDGEERRIGGVFAPYGARSRLLPGGFVEVIEKRCFAKSLSDRLDIVCRLEHDPRWLLGTTESKTLEIEDDPNVGASYRALLPSTQAGDDAWELVRTGRLNHSSMVFQCPGGGDEFRREGGLVVRRLHSVRLLEASPVSQPAYIETSTAVRHLASQVQADPTEVAALAAQGELRTLLPPDRGETVIDLAPTPTPLTVAQRSTASKAAVDGDLDLRRRRSDTRAREYGTDSADPGTRLLDLHRRKLEWRESEQLRLENRHIDAYHAAALTHGT